MIRFYIVIQTSHVLCQVQCSVPQADSTVDVRPGQHQRDSGEVAARAKHVGLSGGGFRGR